MEAGTMRSDTHLSTVESTFDRIESPQYLNFGDDIPEPTDSYFERKAEDVTVKQRKSKKLQRLPNDLEDAFVEPKKEPADTIIESVSSPNRKSPDDIGEDLIQAVKTLQVNNNHPFGIDSKEIVTSTPFRVSGVEPMPWRQSAKPEIKQLTKIRPFSFEERNKQMLQRKAHRIQMQLQAEKDARKFRANPVPKFLKKTTPNNSNDLPAQGTLNAIQKSKSTETGWAPIPFKARSPKVLRRPAFQPNLPRQHLFQPQPFALSSELRAKDRKIFDNFITEKERLDEQIKELNQAKQKLVEENEIINLRKEMVPKAQPIRKFKSASVPVAKRPLTEPMTPIMIKRQRR